MKERNIRMIQNKEIHAHWIHKKIEDPTAVSGFFYARECTCSNCGKEVNMEKPHCTLCGAIMDEEGKDDK